MIPKEIIKKVKKIEIKTRSLVEDVFGGEYHSIFKGHGIDFAEVREYFPGDDVRSIDWNVTARSGVPHIKKYQEERELTVIFLIDASTSGEFGTFEKFKREYAAEICALLAFSAIKNNDKVGLIIFTEEIEKYIPPKKGKKHVMRVITEILSFTPQKRGTDIKVGLDFLNRVLKRKAICFLVSDFFSRDYHQPLKIAAKKNDLIALRIIDRHEVKLPELGAIIHFEDAETGEDLFFDSSDEGLIQEYQDDYETSLSDIETMFKKCNIDFIQFLTDQSYIKPIMLFFRKRARQIRR